MLVSATAVGVIVSLVCLFAVAFYCMSTALEPEWGWPRLSNRDAWFRGALFVGPIVGWITGVVLVVRHRRRVRQRAGG